MKGKDCRRLRKAVSVGRHSQSVDCPGCGGDGTVEVTNDGTKEKKTCQLCKGTGKA